MRNGQNRSVMQYLIDSANINNIKKIMEIIEIQGVTTNPSIICKEGKNLKELITNLRSVLGDKELHIQITKNSLEEILEEAENLVALAGKNTYIKVPVTPVGYQAIRTLKARGFKITATAIFNEHQAIMAAKCGADYVAPYINRIENIPRDSKEVLTNIHLGLRKIDSKCKILAASFKNIHQMGTIFFQAVECLTADEETLERCFFNSLTEKSCEKFEADWEEFKKKGGLL